MSSFDEIKALFTNEIVSSPQYQVALKIKNLLIQDIIAPNIDYTFSYKLQDTDYVDINNKDYENVVIILSLKIILGVEVEINMGYVIVIMDKFLI